ncbi:uncharacterized protein BDV17DRAFT_291042 [Aspergillus undulatus]|uniref:uncharacterized protein n=1 Tax=Aspergillus undulatus TaxID=1810928 RepID=UPI003CCDBFB4
MWASTGTFTPAVLYTVLCVLDPSNYEFTIAGFAILALGGSVVALPGGRSHGTHTNLNTCPSTLWDLPIQTDTNIENQSTRAAIVWFSSGSTGIFKGIVHSREFFHGNSRARDDEAHLVHRNASWVLGSSSIFKSIPSGARAEIIASDANGAELWRRLRERRVTDIKSSPMIYETMARHYQTHISGLPDTERQENIEGARCVGYLNIGFAGYVNKNSRKPATSSTISANTTFSTAEILTTVRPVQPYSFPVSSPLPPKFPTNASTVVKTNAGLVPVQPLEQALSQLPNVETALVIPVPDQTAGRRTGVIGNFSGDTDVTLQSLRDALASLVQLHMLPTALRMLGKEVSLPLNHAGKAVKRQIMEKDFPFTEGVGLPKAVEICD